MGPRVDYATLKTLRKVEDASYEELAASTGLNPYYLNALYCGRREPGRAAVRALAQHYGVEPEELRAMTPDQARRLRLPRQKTSRAA